ncbi:MAG: ATP-binding protein [Clostridia bacterium]|nr:ATP-binding protein [Clostridia bacterium]
MNKISLIYYRVRSIGIFKQTADSVCVRALISMLDAAREKDIDWLSAGWGELISALYKDGASSLSDELYSLLKRDENAFSRACAAGERDEALFKAAEREIAAISALSQISAQELLELAGAPSELSSQLVTWECGDALSADSGAIAEKLSEYYRKNGCGVYSQYNAFIWQDKRLVPVETPDTITFADLKGYRSQRKMLIDNTLAFLGGRPCNNVLLYGDRGTGKSSSVHALLNEFSADGLRMIELSKADVEDFHLISSAIAKVPLKFIVFIDDLSFSQDNDSFARLKAALEGGLAAKPSNMLIYATTNRRHLIKETFESRQGDELHINDSVQEELSLSDRFGIVITFINPDRKQFFDILDAMAQDRGLNLSKEELHTLAERWSLQKGGRSPRGAKQFIDALCSDSEEEN